MDRRVFITLAARLALAAAISMVVQPLLQSVAGGPADAHCPGDTNPTGNIGVTGSQTISGSGVTAVRANVAWTVPNPCFLDDSSTLAFSLEMVNLSRTTSNQGWAQAGWVIREGDASPMYYTEFKGSGSFYDPVHVFAATAGTHNFRCEYFSQDGGLWSCFRDSSTLRTVTFSQMQWTNGNYLVVQGEANAVHAQIGKLLPSKLAFTSMQYKKAAAWSTFNVSAMSNPGFPYGRDEPAAGQFRNWTDGSH